MVATFNDSRCCSILGSQKYIYIKEKKGNQDQPAIRPYFVYFDSHIEEFTHILSNLLCQSNTTTNNSPSWAHLGKSTPVRFDWLYVWPACYYKTSIKCPKRYYLWSDYSLSL